MLGHITPHLPEDGGFPSSPVRVGPWGYLGTVHTTQNNLLKAVGGRAYWLPLWPLLISLQPWSTTGIKQDGEYGILYSHQHDPESRVTFSVF